MKKNLILLFALLCTATFFTACSDDEDTSWQQIPKEEIKGDNAAFTVNGETVANGSVKFEAKSAEQAVVTLDNVILAYPEVAVDVTMAKQADGSYNFSGEKGMTTVPGTRADNQTAIATIKVTGNVTLDGKVRVEANTVVNDPNGWAGTHGLADYATAKLIVKGKEKSYVASGALYFNVEGEKISTTDSLSIINALRGIGGYILPQLLGDITLNSDGNITAKYVKESNIDMAKTTEVMTNMLWLGVLPSENDVKALIPAKDKYVSSPNNLAYWYQKDNKLYVKLNVPVILAQALGTSSNTELANVISSVLNGDVTTIKNLIKGLGIDISAIPDEDITTLLGWVNNGFPMTVKAPEGKLAIYLDKEALSVLLKINKVGDSSRSNLMVIWNVLSKANIIPESMQIAGMLVQSMEGVYAKSSTFDLGLDLTK